LCTCFLCLLGEILSNLTRNWAAKEEYALWHLLICFSFGIGFSVSRESWGSFFGDLWVGILFLWIMNFVNFLCRLWIFSAFLCRFRVFQFFADSEFLYCSRFWIFRIQNFVVFVFY
jgi:hypothetical protein